MPLYEANHTSLPRWASFENPLGTPHAGAMTNRGAKGSPAKSINPGETVTLMQAQGSGVVRRIWMTVDRRDSATLRRMILCMTWDNALAPAVCCPLADFFGFGLASMKPYQSELFASPEGRSFVCFIPMPFYTGACITLHNGSSAPIGLFYDVAYTLEPLTPGSALYFHAHWRRESPTELGREYTVLPQVHGHGRFLGASIGVLADTAQYQDTWFGEGEMKFYLDGDSQYPTLCGTGTEDYIGDAWGQAPFVNATTGCLEGDAAAGRFAFYRWHTVDPIYFQRDMRVTIHNMGNDVRDKVRAIQDAGADMIITHENGRGVYDPAHPYLITDTSPDGGYCFYRRDDYCSTAYFYLDSPEDGLPPLADESLRVKGM